MKPSAFTKSITFFHLNVPFKTTGYFKVLDWTYLQKNLRHFASTFNIEIQALIMMDTHFHLLIGVTSNNENFFCDEINKKLADPAGDGAFCEPIKNLSQYLNSYKYIYNNPVKAGICQSVESYPFSSLQILLGKCSKHCLIADKMGLIQNPNRILNWLNSNLPFKDSEVQRFIN